MSEPFTIDGSNWQEKAEELRLAFSERSRVISGWKAFIYLFGEWTWFTGPEDTPIQGGENLQAESFWNGLQAGIESLAGVKSTYGFDFTGADTLYTYGDSDEPWLDFCRDVGGLLYESDEDYGWPKLSEFDEEGEPVYTRGRFAVLDYISGDMIDAIVLAFKNLDTFVSDEVDAPDGSYRRKGNGEYEYTEVVFVPPNTRWQLAYDDAVANLADDQLIVNPFSTRGTNSNATESINPADNFVYKVFLTQYDFNVAMPVKDIEAIGLDLYYKDNPVNPYQNYSFANGPLASVDVYDGLPGPPPSGYTPTAPGFLFNDYKSYETVTKYDFTNS